MHSLSQVGVGARRERRAVASMEFAVVAPVMVIILLCTIELTNIIRVQAKVTVMAGQLAELVAGQSSVTIGTATGAAMSGSLTDLCTGAAMSLLPYTAGLVQASIGSVTSAFTLGYEHPVTDWTTDTACGATSYHAGQSLLYSYSNTPSSFFTVDGTPYGAGGVPVDGYSAISVQIRYTYMNVLPHVFGKSILLTGSGAARPRSNSRVTCTTTPSGTTTPIACPQNP